jgi:hypothetical protein
MTRPVQDVSTPDSERALELTELVRIAARGAASSRR